MVKVERINKATGRIDMLGKKQALREITADGWTYYAAEVALNDGEKIDAGAFTYKLLRQAWLPVR